MKRMNVKLIAHTPNPEQVVACAAKLCYSNSDIESLMDKQTPEESAKFVGMLSSMGHESPTEHVSFTFGIEGVSRALLAQITRHRLASYSVQSQRYVRLEDFDFIIPPEIEDDDRSKAFFIDTMKMEAEKYIALTSFLEQKHTTRLIAEGMEEREAKKAAAKLANEDARFALPNACETKMIVTMNARELKHFFNLRCCNRAQWEIRALADEMFRLVYQVAPSLFKKCGPDCLYGACGEGKMSCGKAQEVKERFEALKG